MSTRSRSAQLLSRTALLLALLCLWISGGATLHHTDEPPLFAAGHSAVGHATPPVTLSPCAACEWEQSFSHPSAPCLQVAFLPLIRLSYVAALLPVLHLRCFDHTAPRGPPFDLS